ncbi:hypothetical protein NHH88_06780 [Oxalobacteraceae bacterium OTU3CAMAD1]|nr:hypothetical protein NHH88_06780 [Oxalobacteraceae bacterium OTU3CAMAD1]
MEKRIEKLERRLAAIELDLGILKATSDQVGPRRGQGNHYFVGCNRRNTGADAAWPIEEVWTYVRNQPAPAGFFIYQHLAIRSRVRRLNVPA